MNRTYFSDEAAEIERRLGPRILQHALPAVPMPPLATSMQDCLPLIRQMAARLHRGQIDRRNWPVVRGAGNFELAVAPENQMRALLTMDRLVRHCVASGLRLVADEKSNRPANFLIEGKQITFRIFESGRQQVRELTSAERKKLDAVPDAYIPGGKYEYRATNRLKLEVMVPWYRWTEFTVQDGSDTPLADRLADVPAKMLEVAIKMKLRDEVRAEESQREEQARQTVAERRARRDAELARLAQFEDWAHRLERAVRLRALVVALERSNTADHFGGAERMDWLQEAADWLDPTVLRPWPEVDGAG